MATLFMEFLRSLLGWSMYSHMSLYILTEIALTGSKHELPTLRILEPKWLSLTEVCIPLLVKKDTHLVPESGLENREYIRGDPLCCPRNTPIRKSSH
jgi:hypothetical protein